MLRQSFFPGALALCLLVGACASQMRPPNASLDLEIRSVDFETGSAQQIIFHAMGYVRNPNELAISRLGFTYQTFVDDYLVDSGEVNSPLRFPFKSRTAFVAPIRIPTSAMGGYVNASDLNGLRYKIILRVTDGRFKHTTLTHESSLNLSHLLDLPYIEARATDYEGQLLVDAVVTNPNVFILVVDSCSITFSDSGVITELFSTSAFAPKGNKTYSIPVAVVARKGETLNAVYSCRVDGTPVETRARITVQ